LIKRPENGCTHDLRAATRLRAIILSCIIAAIAIGCSVTPRNYKTLSFFFDGVPDPAVSGGPGAAGGSGGKPTFVVTHKPFADEHCDACHRTKYRPTKNDATICLECHAAVQTQYPKMHGAVIATACLWCHNPHESSHPALLRNSDRKVCSQCHTVAMLESTRVPAHADPARGCVECHSGHGSTLPFMLKPGVASPTPTPEQK